MSVYKISNRYAAALLNISLEAGVLDKTAEDVELADRAFRDSRDLILFFKSPVIKKDKKLKIVRELFQSKTSPLFSNFLDIVIKKGRESYIPDIIREFRSLKDKHFGIMNVGVTAFSELTKEQSESIRKKLESVTGKKITLSVKTDKTLKGGFIIKLDDTIFDASIKRQLEILHQKFLFGQLN